jgi:hypothetical protein
MGPVLKNILAFTGLPVGVPTSLPHRLNVAGTPVAPQTIATDASGFTVAADALTVTVTRTTGAAAVNVYVEHWHTIEAALPPGDLAGLTPFQFGGGASSKSASTILWAPGGGGDATTWAEVMAFVGAANPPLTVYLNGSASIPPGLYNVNGMQLISDPEIDTFTITLADGAQLENLAGILGQITLKSLSTALTPLVFGPPLPSGAPHALKLEFNASLENAGAVPMIEVGAGEIFVISGLFNATLTDTAPVVNLGAAATVIIGVYGNLTITDGYVTGPADATLVYQVVTGGLPTPLPTNAGFAGTTLQNVLTGWSCTTAGRPSVNPLYTLHTGTMTFDTDLGIPIWWDGAQWVNASGAPV